jgi:hypothetical protein
MVRFLRKISRGSRVGVILLLTVGAALLAAPSAVAGGRAGYGCSPGFDLGAITFDQSLSLPRVQAGLAAGVYDEADLVSAFNATDKNGDGVICVQDLGALTGDAGGNFTYVYNVVDDNASVPTR